MKRYLEKNFNILLSFMFTFVTFPKNQISLSLSLYLSIWNNFISFPLLFVQKRIIYIDI